MRNAGTAKPQKRNFCNSEITLLVVTPQKNLKCVCTKKEIINVNFSISGFNSTTDTQKKGLENWKTGQLKKNPN